MSAFKDLTGQKFGRLTVVSRAENKSGIVYWNCLCECGNLKMIQGCALKSGATVSCGCFQIESRITHGASYIPEFSVWVDMLRRCYNAKRKDFSRYGGRGIKVCEEWAVDFWNFYRDMGERPSPKHSIERLDNDGDYTLSNCIWATATKQARNTRIFKTNKTGVQGVCIRGDNKKFRAYLSVKSKRIWLGTYDSLEDASRARKEGELKYWGEGVISHV